MRFPIQLPLLLTLLASPVMVQAQPPLSSRAASPIVVAHRGASGYLPEHTLPAYAMAHAMGADYIEQDLVMTRDGVLLVLHDIHLEATSNVAERFPDRARPDGRWYAADFTLEEIRTLEARERLASRFPQGAARFALPTFSEAIELVQGLNTTTGREAGIYPELKAGGWHREEGLPMEEEFLRVLGAYGYTGPDAHIFVQSFEEEPLIRMRELGSELPQILLIGGGAAAARFLTDEGLALVRSFANGIGPSKGLVEADPTLVERAHRAGLAVHPYTFRADAVPAAYADPQAELRRFFVDYGVDGLFTDHPDLAVELVRSLPR